MIRTPELEIEPGSRTFFDQDTAPLGWVRDTAVDDRLVRVVTGARSHGGSWTVSGLMVASHTHSVTTAGSHDHGGTGTVANHTHTITNTGAHQHDEPADLAAGTTTYAKTTAPYGTGTAFTEQRNVAVAGASVTATFRLVQSVGAHDHGGAQGAGSHSHTISSDGAHDHGGAQGATAAVSSDGSWRPARRDTIVAVRN